MIKVTRRGIILDLSEKNKMSVDMLLKDFHLALFVSNRNYYFMK